MDILTNLSLFSGIGGLDLAAKWTGKIKTVCYVENEPYCQAVLMSRFRDGQLDEAPIWDDVKTFDGLPWAGCVDIVSGGFPCQDVSVAGKRQGLNKGQRSRLWIEMCRIIRAVGPPYVLVENVPGLFSLGFGHVLGDLAESGYDAEWFCYSASSTGAPHKRERVWIVANTRSKLGGRKRGGQWCPKYAHHNYWDKGRSHKLYEAYQSGIFGIYDGLARDVDRLRCCGNGVVPQQAFPAWEKILEMAEFNDTR